MGPFVAVHVEPAPVDPRDLVVLLESCSSALPRGDCLADTTPQSEPPAALASVRWVDEWSAHIDAHVGGAHSSTLRRELTFSRDDARRERFRSVGLAIATLLDELRLGEEPRAPSPPTAATAAVVQPPSHATPRAPSPAPAPTGTPPPRAAESAPPHSPRADTIPAGRFGSVDVGGLFGTGLAGSSARVGPYARVAHELHALPLFVDARVSYAVGAAGGTPSVDWLDAGLGAGARLTAASVRFELGMRALVSRTSASAPSPQTGANDTATSVVPGLGVDARVSWPAASALAATLGADGTALLHEVRITNAGEEVAHVNAYNVGVIAGVRLYF